MKLTPAEQARAALANMEARKREEEREDLAAVLESPHGRRFVWHFIHERCRLKEKTHRPNSESIFLEGRRSIGIELDEAAQRLFPEMYRDMTMEALKAEQERRIKREQAENILRKEQANDD